MCVGVCVSSQFEREVVVVMMMKKKTSYAAMEQKDPTTNKRQQQQCWYMFVKCVREQNPPQLSGKFILTQSSYHHQPKTKKTQIQIATL